MDEKCAFVLVGGKGTRGGCRVDGLEGYFLGVII